MIILPPSTFVSRGTHPRSHFATLRNIPVFQFCPRSDSSAPTSPSPCVGPFEPRQYRYLIVVASGDYHDAFAPGAEQTPGWSPSGAAGFSAACSLLRKYRYMMRQAGGGGGAPMTTMSLIPESRWRDLALLSVAWHAQGQLRKGTHALGSTRSVPDMRVGNFLKI
jgi:hypothetical protein